MKLAGYIVLILAAAVLEAVVPRVFHLDVLRPLLVAALVLHFALRLGTVEGAALSLFAGLAEDATSGFATGLAGCACVCVFVAAKLALGAVRADGRVFEFVFSGVLAFFWHVAVTGLERVLGPDLVPLADVPWLRATLFSVLATALASPLVFQAARRIERLEKRPAGML